MTTLSPARPKPTVPPLLKIRDVARLLTISRQTVRALIESGDLEAHPLRRKSRKTQRTHVRITSESLTGFYRKRFGHDLDPALLLHP
jgi:excisionase family DNA binding protein